MTISNDVMNDLLTLYLAGEASADSKALVEEYARGNEAFAARLTSASALSMPGPPPGAGLPPDDDLRALRRTREFIRLRTVFTAGGVLFTLMPLVFTFGADGAEFLILGRHPGLVWSFWSLAAASWSACFVMHRQIRLTGV
jgi:hypothetical protein